ncbi:MAG: flavoprotein, partial [Clostridia bacterium]
MLKGKVVVIGVCGGIAAYKAADVISKLKKLNAEVHVIMTHSACEFIQPLTLQALSQNMVVTDMFERPRTWEIEHIALAQKADLFVIVPATANMIGKMANGIADDMLSTTVMAAKCPVIFAPAMNCNMYENAIVQENIEK